MKGAPARRQKGVWFRRTARVLTNNWQRAHTPEKTGRWHKPSKTCFVCSKFWIEKGFASLALQMIFWEKIDSHLVALALGFFKKGVFYLLKKRLKKQAATACLHSPLSFQRGRRCSGSLSSGSSLTRIYA